MTDMVDERDRSILSELAKDARQSTSDISRKTGIPRVTVHERIQRLKEKGVIKRFTIERDYALCGRPTTAFVLVGFAPTPGTTTNQRQLAKEIAALDGVHSVHIIAGEWDILVKARAESLEKLGGLVIDRLRKLKGVAKTTTMAVLSSVKEEF